MNLIDRVKGLFGISFGGPGASTYQSAIDWSMGLPISSPSGIERPYAQHPTVAICVSVIAQDAASVERELYPEGSRDEDDEIEDHPLLDFWQKPNSSMSGNDIWVASYTYFNLYGECFWYYPGLRIGTIGAMRANRRSTGEILVIDPCSVILKIAKDNKTVEYYQRIGGVDYPLDVKYLTHFKRFNPYNPLRGLSVLEALALELNLDWNAANWNNGFFGDQNGIPTGLLKPPLGAIIPPTEREDYLKSFNSRHSKKRGVGILPPGFEWLDVGGSPKDMQFGEQREFSREQILAVFGVPPFMAGVLDKANYANAREQSANYWNGPITRLLTYFAATLNYDFMPKVGVEGVEVWPDFEGVKALTEDLNSKSDIAGKLFAMGFTKRQLNDRLELGLEVDDLEDADIGYLPISLLPVTMVEEAHTPVGPVQPQGSNGQNGEIEEKPPAKGYLRAAPAAIEGRRANVWRSIATRTRDLEARFERAIRKHFKDIETQVLAQLNALKGWNLIHGVEKADSSGLFDIQYYKAALIRMVAPLYQESIKRGGTSVLSEINASEPLNMLAPGVQSQLAQLTAKITGIDDTVERLLRESIVEGIMASEGVPQLTKRIQGIMDASRSRAATIARTETGKAFNSGRVVGMIQEGISKQEWLTARDSHVRDSHVPLDGDIRAIGEAFSNGLLYPGDPSGDPEEVINCRCTILPVIGEVANV